jgi:hypothetical protein
MMPSPRNGSTTPLCLPVLPLRLVSASSLPSRVFCLRVPPSYPHLLHLLFSPGSPHPVVTSHSRESKSEAAYRQQTPDSRRQAADRQQAGDKRQAADRWAGRAVHVLQLQQCLRPTRTGSIESYGNGFLLSAVCSLLSALCCLIYAPCLMLCAGCSLLSALCFMLHA